MILINPESNLILIQEEQTEKNKMKSPRYTIDTPSHIQQWNHDPKDPDILFSNFETIEDCIKCITDFSREDIEQVKKQDNAITIFREAAKENNYYLNFITHNEISEQKYQFINNSYETKYQFINDSYAWNPSIDCLIFLNIKDAKEYYKKDIIADYDEIEKIMEEELSYYNNWKNNKCTKNISLHSFNDYFKHYLNQTNELDMKLYCGNYNSNKHNTKQIFKHLKSQEDVLQEAENYFSLAAIEPVEAWIEIANLPEIKGE